MKQKPQHAPEVTLEAVTLEHTEDAHHAPEMWYDDPANWVAISFLLFMVIAVKHIFPLITRGLDGRADKIREQLEQASRLRAEAEALLASYQRQKHEKLQEADAIISSAQKEAAALAARAAVELTQAIARRTQQAEERIARAEAEAIAQIRRRMIDMATNEARTLITAELEDAKSDPALERAISAIRSQIH